MTLVVTEGLGDDTVLQRDARDCADVLARGTASEDVSGVLYATVYRREVPLPGWEKREVGVVRGGTWEATLTSLPTGGPYVITFSVAGQPDATATIRNILVGDLWVLAGQSNMEGVGDLVDVEPPSPYVHVFDMADRWHVAEEPLHWLCDSPDPCHCDLTGEAQQQNMAEARRTRTKGAGLGLSFAKAMTQATGVPIGLLACAHGGTSMQQWSPAEKGRGGSSLYGSMLGRVARAGGKVRGVLWYQGESDANPQDVTFFSERFKKLVAEVRADFGDPNLPFYTVQIGRFVPEGGGPHDPTPWNAIQDLQRRLAEEIPHSAVAPAIDLELDDLIHIGTQGLKRLGRRLARVALHDLQGQSGPRPGIRLNAVTVEGENRTRVRVSYTGVAAGGFVPSLQVNGFSFHRPDGTPYDLIYKAQTDPQNPSDVLLHLVTPLPPGFTLRYGYGLDPVCTLTDVDDMAAPVFGPVAL